MKYFEFKGKNNIKLYQDDCLNAMNEIPDKSVNMILTDLPYGITARNKWDEVIPFNDYVCIDGQNYNLDEYLLKAYQTGTPYEDAFKYFNEHKTLGLWTQYDRVIKDNGAIVLFGSGMFTTNLIKSNPKEWRYNLIWQKTLPTGFLNAKKMPLMSHEDICVFYKKLPTYNPQKTTGHERKAAVRKSTSTNYGVAEKVTAYDSTERFPTSVWTFSHDKQKSHLHPTQKPIALLENLIKTYTNEGELVLDSCMGSGSTGKACMNLNRNFIGIEKDENYYKIARERILDPESV